MRKAGIRIVPAYTDYLAATSLDGRHCGYSQDGQGGGKDVCCAKEKL